MMIACLQDPGPHCYHSNTSAWTATWTGIHRYHSLTFKRFCMDRYTSLLPLTFKPFQMLLHYTLCTSYQSLSFATTSLYSLITNSNKYNFFSCHIWSYVNTLKSWKTTLRVVKMLSEPLKWLWERCTLPKKVARHFDRFDCSGCSGKRPKRPERNLPETWCILRFTTCNFLSSPSSSSPSLSYSPHHCASRTIISKPSQYVLSYLAPPNLCWNLAKCYCNWLLM